MYTGGTEDMWDTQDMRDAQDTQDTPDTIGAFKDFLGAPHPKTSSCLGKLTLERYLPTRHKQQKALHMVVGWFG